MTMTFDFVYPRVLLLLWTPLLLAGGARLATVKAQKRLQRFAGPAMLPQLAPPGNLPRRRLQLALAVPALMLLIVACARPRWGERPIGAHTGTRNLMVLLDVSRSMLAEDVAPSRLERARMELHDLAASLGDDRVGLIAFRNGAAMLCPLTRDHGFFKFALNGADLDAAPAGPTDITAGLLAAL